MAKRKIPCPYCKGQVLSTSNGRATSSQTLFPRLQNLLTAISDLLSVITGGQQTISRKDAIGGKCKTCGGSGKIEDPTDTKDADKAAAQYLDGVKDKILAAEKRRGMSPGGNMLERIAGDRVTIIGQTLNNAKSVTVHKGKGAPPVGNVTGMGDKTGTPTTVGPEKDKGPNVITGNNVPSNGGGMYYIQCGNKFKLTAGAQGIELGSHGPISIDGTQVRISGAEVTVGGSSGPTVIEGDHMQLNGKSIALTPSGSQGEVVIQGSASCSGNLKAGGGYVENMYCASLTMPSQQSSSKVSSGGSDFIGGPAKWGGMNTALPVLATQNLIKWLMDSTTDINLAGGVSPINPRGIIKNNDNLTSLLYSMYPMELVQTGWAIISYGSSSGMHPIYNFPHSHAEPDQPHSHDMTVPAISHEGNSTADVVRKKFNANGGNSKLPAGPTENGNPLIKFVASVGGALKALGAAASAVFPYQQQ
jgi:hypothetical protein